MPTTSESVCCREIPEVAAKLQAYNELQKAQLECITSHPVFQILRKTSLADVMATSKARRLEVTSKLFSGIKLRHSAAILVTPSGVYFAISKTRSESQWGK